MEELPGPELGDDGPFLWAEVAASAYAEELEVTDGDVRAGASASLWGGLRQERLLEFVHQLEKVLPHFCIAERHAANMIAGDATKVRIKGDISITEVPCNDGEKTVVARVLQKVEGKNVEIPAKTYIKNFQVAKNGKELLQDFDIYMCGGAMKRTP